jgi:hypothetical protein
MRACLIKWRSLISTGKPNIVTVPTQAVCGGSMSMYVRQGTGTTADAQYSSSPMHHNRNSVKGGKTYCDMPWHVMLVREGGRVGTLSAVYDYNNRP